MFDLLLIAIALNMLLYIAILADDDDYNSF